MVEGWGEDGLRALRGALHAQDGAGTTGSAMSDSAAGSAPGPV
ncbi:hypothetical protein [Streptomyces sp. NPDC006739]